MLVLDHQNLTEFSTFLVPTSIQYPLLFTNMLSVAKSPTTLFVRANETKEIILFCLHDTPPPINRRKEKIENNTKT